MLPTRYDITNKTSSSLLLTARRLFSRRDAREQLSKLLEHFFPLHGIRHKDLEAIPHNFWNTQSPIRPRQPLGSLEPLHPPHLCFQEPRFANLDILNQFQDPEQTSLDAIPSPSKRSNHPCQICDTEPEFLGPSIRSKYPCFEDQEESHGFEQVAFDPEVCKHQDCSSDNDTDDYECDT